MKSIVLKKALQSIFFDYRSEEPDSKEKIRGRSKQRRKGEVGHKL
jgi:hypothetical protein